MRLDLNPRYPVKFLPLIASLAVVLGLGSALAQETANANYRISASDRIAISVHQEDELCVERAVANNGMVTLPLIEEIRVAGKTAREAEKAIEAAYRDERFLRHPQVTVTVAQFVERSISVLGAVNKPGTVVIPGGQVQIDLMTAIANAGDFKQIANKKKVRITRKNGKIIEINAEDIISGKSKPVVLFPGDIVSVKQRWI